MPRTIFTTKFISRPDPIDDFRHHIGTLGRTVRVVLIGEREIRSTLDFGSRIKSIGHCMKFAGAAASGPSFQIIIERTSILSSACSSFAASAICD